MTNPDFDIKTELQARGMTFRSDFGQVLLLDSTNPDDHDCYSINVTDWTEADLKEWMGE